jgi:hypothetical protein
MIKKLIDFWHRNRTFIWIVLSVMFLMNLCGRMFMPNSNAYKQSTEIGVFNQEGDDPILLKSYDEIMDKRIEDKKTQNKSFFNFALLVTAISLLIYYLYKKDWITSLRPSVVWLRTCLAHNRTNGRLLIEIIIYNFTRESKTFETPYIYFNYWHKQRVFKVNSGLFPITLTPGTTHKLTIDVDNFYDKVAGLKKFGRIGVKVETSNGKIYKNIALPRWMVFKKV